MTDDKSARDEDEALKARLGKLSEALNATNGTLAKRSAEDAANHPASGNIGGAVNLGFRVMSEFVAGIIAGGLIGWLLDGWFGTSPAALVVFILLGTAAGFWNVYRIAATTPGAGAGR
jgi:ATP synthase protein I